MVLNRIHYFSYIDELSLRTKVFFYFFIILKIQHVFKIFHYSSTILIWDYAEKNSNFWKPHLFSQNQIFLGRKKAGKGREGTGNVKEKGSWREKRAKTKWISTHRTGFFGWNQPKTPKRNKKWADTCNRWLTDRQS